MGARSASASSCSASALSVAASPGRSVSAPTLTHSASACPLELRKVLVRDSEEAARREACRPASLTNDPEEALATDCDIVVEVMGGEEPAHELHQARARAARYVVTANKEVMAKHGPQLLAMATSAGVDILYEASVGGGIPIISPLKRDLSANDITSLRAIINGTTNYILTRMSREGDRLRRRAEAGAGPGLRGSRPDERRRGARRRVQAGDPGEPGIPHDRPPRERLPRGDHAPHAARLPLRRGAWLRDQAAGDRAARRRTASRPRVHPTLSPEDELLASVDGVLNAVQVEGDLTGRVLFQGAGAGSLPTTSAIMADVLDAARSIVLGGKPSPWRYTADMAVRPISGLVSRHYLRLEVADPPGVLARIASSFGDNGVSIASVIQKETDDAAQTAELVDHDARRERSPRCRASLDADRTLAEVHPGGQRHPGGGLAWSPGPAASRRSERQRRPTGSRTNCARRRRGCTRSRASWRRR